MSVMKDREKAISAGLIIQDRESCSNCHIKNNPEHTKKPFIYENEWKKITHLIPKK